MNEKEQKAYQLGQKHMQDRIFDTITKLFLSHEQELQTKEEEVETSWEKTLMKGALRAVSLTGQKAFARIMAEPVFDLPLQQQKKTDNVVKFPIDRIKK